MKEYLFRGKSLITGSMVHGNLFQREQQSFILTGGHVMEVLSETVGQYIGVTDMHGNKIFEGDILLDKTEEYQGTVCSVGSSMEIVIELNNDRLYPSDLVSSTVEVIGNRYDDPELWQTTQNAEQAEVGV